MATTKFAVDVKAGPDARLQWDDTIRDIFGAVDMKVGQPFSGRIRASSLGSIHLTEVASTSEHAWRTARHIARDSERSYVLAFVRSGRLALEQLGRTCDTGPGGFVLFDLARPYRYNHPSLSNVLSLKIPEALLDGRLSRADRYLASPGHAGHGLGRVTRDALEALAAEAGRIPELVGAAYAARMIDLVAILLEAGAGDRPMGDSAARAALFSRALLHIEAHLSDPGLDPAGIAAATGISLRYLHKIFQENGESVCDLIRTRRLSRCHADLAETRAGRSSVKEIAFRAGFRSQAHFSAAFRREYRMSPSELRAASSRPN